MESSSTIFIIGPPGWERNYLRKPLNGRFKTVCRRWKEFDPGCAPVASGKAVILLLPGENGAGLTGGGGRPKFGCPFILIETNQASDDWLLRGLTAGASAVLPMPVTMNMVEDALSCAGRDGCRLSPRVGRLLVGVLHESVSNPVGWRLLTHREKEIVKKLASGWPNKHIGDALTISLKTVETHLTNIYRKLEVHSRSEVAARFAPKFHSTSYGG
jgi:DNA-binding NarL/FixJ family response regulator